MPMLGSLVKSSFAPHKNTKKQQVSLINEPEYKSCHFLALRVDTFDSVQLKGH